MLAARRARPVMVALAAAAVLGACGGEDGPAASPEQNFAVAERRLAIAEYCLKLISSQDGTAPEPTEAEREKEIEAVTYLEQLLLAGDGNLVLDGGETLREQVEDQMEGLAVGNCDPDGEERLEAALDAG